MKSSINIRLYISLSVTIDILTSTNVAWIFVRIKPWAHAIPYTNIMTRFWCLSNISCYDIVYKSVYVPFRSFFLLANGTITQDVSRSATSSLGLNSTPSLLPSKKVSPFKFPTATSEGTMKMADRPTFIGRHCARTNYSISVLSDPN